MALNDKEAHILSEMLKTAVQSAVNANGYLEGYKILKDAALTASKLLKE